MSNVTITVALNTEGGSSGDRVVPAGTTHVKFFGDNYPGQNIDNYTIRVNRVTLSKSNPHTFLSGDMLTITPNKVAGA